MKSFVLLLALSGFRVVAHAQSREVIYTAPGMPLHLQRGVPVGSPQSRKPRVKQLAVDSSQTFARFWDKPSALHQQSAQVFWQAINRETKYPSTTLRAQIEGTIYVQLIVLADGSIAKAEIIKRQLNEELADNSNTKVLAKAKDDLDAEALKPLAHIRFAAGAKIDTIVVPRRFVMQ
ncbi:hypothetical protein GCM10022409_04290 [Hymenobacter glaciei]|uniref:TonB C-terminal domain-containing protein n=1 Tax=Hymenobacter glaciei TaxID=877209 RepID=A0ABP7TAR6_9BACT